jgi:hypothetical protein
LAGSNEEEAATAGLRRALKLVIEAIDLMDAFGGPPETTAHLELGRQSLRDFLKCRKKSEP